MPGSSPSGPVRTDRETDRTHGETLKRYLPEPAFLRGRGPVSFREQQPVVHGFWKFGRWYPGSDSVGLASLLVTKLLALAIPWLLRDAIDAIERGTGSPVVGRLAVCHGGVGRGRPWCGRGRGWTILGRQPAHRARRARARSSPAAWRLGAYFFDVQRTGDVMSRGVNDIQLLQGVLRPGRDEPAQHAIVYAACSRCCSGSTSG